MKGAAISRWVTVCIPVLTMRERHTILLIPGFFGFGNLGDLRYFVGVKERLLDRLGKRTDQEFEVVEVSTLPTASIRQRAARVLDAITERLDGGSQFHLVGHSTGGLDARLAIAPTAALPVKHPIEGLEIYKRIRTLVTVSTPHYGTPLAGFFGSAMGKPLLRVLSAATILILERGKLPLSLALKLGRAFSRFDDWFGQRETVLDQLYRQLLDNFSPERRKSLIELVDAIGADQSLVFQLTAAGCDILNASTAHPDSVRYGCVVTSAARPSLRHVFGLRGDLYSRSLHVVYAALWTIAARSVATMLPKPEDQQLARLQALLGALPQREDNDGIVPSLSQVWGEVIHATRGDHLDVVGHFGFSGRYAGGDWLPTGSGFEQDAFDKTWDQVAKFIAPQLEAAKCAVEPVEHPPLEPVQAPHPALAKQNVDAATPP
jgi:triacylglycerol esterase/lipase EstA (alpha/beta hydrolase family)